MSSLSNNLRQARMDKGLTQTGLAAAIGLTRQTVNNYETARSTPKADSLLKISTVLGVRLDDLLPASMQQTTSAA